MTADLVFVNGPVYTGVTTAPWANAVAVAGDRIEAVGNESKEWIDAGTEVVDLEGRMLIAGFQDAHIHVLSGGLDLIRCNLNDDTGPKAALATIGRYAASHPGEEWILGGGWSYDWYPGGFPDAASLDREVADRPVFLSNRDGHSAWVNSTALRLAGIDRHTPDPPDGRIERLADGGPSGALHEGAQRLVARLIPPDSPHDLDRALAAGLAYVRSCGITAWQEAWVTPEMVPIYRAAAAEGRLGGHVSLAMWWERHVGLGQIEWFEEERRHPAPGLRLGTVKLMLDGVCENFTAAMLEPYEGAQPAGGSGLDFIAPDLLKDAVTELDKRGFQCHFHAIGDRATRNALDAVAEARRRNRSTSDLRHHIAHLQVIHPADINRFAELEVVANAQALWASHGHCQDELNIPFLGAERAAWQYPFASLVNSGARLAMGSDWSVSTANVMAQIEVAVNRVDPEEDSTRPFLLEQRLGLDTCLRAFTSGSAYVNHRDGESGSIEVGKVADLVVLDRNPFTEGPIGETQVDLTFVAGHPVYQRLG